MSTIELEFTVSEYEEGQRFDKVLAMAWPEYSRSRIQQWIEDGQVLVNGEQIQTKLKAKEGDHCVLAATVESQEVWLPEPMDLNVVYKDEHIIILNKQADLVVHPAAGNWSGTLVNGLLYNFPELEALPRAGIVHRLDKDTTGLMVVARTLEAHHQLVKAMQEREIKRGYLALVYGQSAEKQFSVTENIGRHPKNRLKMAVVGGGKPARTHFRVKQKLSPFTLFEVKLDTGRTHQIRVHLQHVGFPIFGDQLYGNEQGQSDDIQLKRQALHAWRLRLAHPITGQVMAFEGRLPADFETVLQKLGADPITNQNT